MTSDPILLKRFAESRDAEAFTEMVRRSAGLVYSTCLRVTGNRPAAEDAAQECFLQLARAAGEIRGSLPGLASQNGHHQRSHVHTRREPPTPSRAEVSHMAGFERATQEPTWAEVAPFVDEALSSLPEELREPLLLHFLQEKTQADVASALGIDQSTVSRHLEKGLKLLRERLAKRGVIVAVGLLATLLAGNAALAAPVTLTAGLMKMAMAGVGNAAKTSAAGVVAANAAVKTGGIAVKVTGAALGATTIVVGGIIIQTALGQNHAPAAVQAEQAEAVPATPAPTAVQAAPAETAPALHAQDDDWRKIIEPSRVTVKFENAPAAEAFKKLGELTGNLIAPPLNYGQSAKNVTAEFKNEPFWKAVGALSRNRVCVLNQIERPRHFSRFCSRR